MRLRRGNVGSGGSVEGMPINAQLLDNPKSDRVRRIADLTRTKGRRKGQFNVAARTVTVPTHDVVAYRLTPVK